MMERQCLITWYFLKTKDELNINEYFRSTNREHKKLYKKCKVFWSNSMFVFFTLVVNFFVGDLNVLKEAMLDALKFFINKDANLLKLDVREEAISHRLAFYLEQTFSRLKYDLSLDVEEIESITVDCEYDKHSDAPKTLQDIIQKYPKKKTNVIRPDIVLHKRNSGTNLIVIEIKKEKSKDKDKEYAKDKVKAFVESSYAYQLGIYIVFNTGADGPIKNIATFSKNNYKDPNEKLLKMLNTLEKDGFSEQIRNSSLTDWIHSDNILEQDIYSDEEYWNECWDDYCEAIENNENLREKGWYYSD